jgi:hypothetical protein
MENAALIEPVLATFPTCRPREIGRSQAMISLTTLPWTSVRRKSLPA